MSRSVWSRASLVSWFVWLAVGWLAGGGLLAGCGEDRSASASATPAVSSPSSASPIATAAAPLSTSTSSSSRVQVMPDGSLELRPRLTDVALLERQPDGSYRRTCGRPSAETLAVMEAARRARRGTK